MCMLADMFTWNARTTCILLDSRGANRELTNRRLLHDGAVGSPYSSASSSCRNLNLRFAVKTTTFMRDRQIFPPFLNFAVIFWQGELFKPKCLTSEKRELLSHTRLWKQLYKRTRICTLDCHKSTNPEFPYWNYDRFDLDEKSNDECKAELRFYREDIYKLAEQLQLPDEITTYTGLVVASVPALYMYLKRFAYPCRYGDLVYHFARPVPEISIITNRIMDLIYSWCIICLQDTITICSLLPKLLQYAEAIEQAGLP